MKLRLASAAIFLLAVAALSGPAAAQEESQSFAMPSGNISCRYVPVYSDDPAIAANLPTLSCERDQPSAARVFLGPKGAGEVFKDVPDPFCCDADKTVAYGETWETGPFTCISAKDGLTCRRRDGHGFFISRSALRAY